MADEANVSKESEQTAPDAPEIPGYSILGKLGTGGMATVYLANQQSFDREVALKVMAPALAADPNYGDRFMREARIAARFSHPNIIAVYDVGQHQDHYYIAMEYHSGGDLKRRLRKGMTTKEALAILRQMAAALDYAHIKGYIHRDVKPDNILFREDGSAVLTDFGIARPTAGDTQMTQLGMVVGTPKYMSPEQARGLDLDSRSDIYSLGIVFYEMMVGRVPFDGKDSIDIGIKHVKEPVPPLPDKMKALQPLVDRMLAKQPENRYARGRELIADLDQIRLGVYRNQQQGVSGQVRAVAADRAVPTTRPAPSGAIEGLDDTIPPPSISQRHQGSRFGFLVLPLVVAGGGWLLYSSGALDPLIEQIADARPVGIDKAVEIPVKQDQPQSQLTLAMTDDATRLAGESLAGTINSQLQPAALPIAGFAASAAGQLSDIDPLALPEEDFQTRIVNEMLAEADTLMSAGRLVAPEGSNALESYRGVLTLDEDNPTALAGLQAIGGHYLGLADKALAAGSLKPAGQHLQQARDVAPDLEGLDSTQRQLDQALAEQEARIAKARARKAEQAQAQTSSIASAAPARPAPQTSSADAMLGKFKVKGLLRSAEYDMAEGRYTSPAENNALHKYRQVLQLSPGNAEALRGLQSLNRQLETELDKTLQRGDKAGAMAILQELRMVNPNNPRIQQATALVTSNSDGEPAPALEPGDSVTITPQEPRGE